MLLSPDSPRDPFHHHRARLYLLLLLLLSPQHWLTARSSLVDGHFCLPLLNILLRGVLLYGQINLRLWLILVRAAA